MAREIDATIVCSIATRLFVLHAPPRSSNSNTGGGRMDAAPNVAVTQLCWRVVLLLLLLLLLLLRSPRFDDSGGRRHTATLGGVGRRSLTD
uniref:Secreted protein n=1 Tax=Plectus sambesii TaxID=2011161 RepID=A0A914V8X5_9BILA